MIELSHTTKVRIVRYSALILVVAGWFYFAGPGGVSPIILPKPIEVVRSLWQFLFSGELYAAAAVTFGEILVALMISAVAGIVIGFLGARNAMVGGVLEPLLVWAYLVPTIVLYPLLLLWLGFGVESKIGYAVLSAFPPIAFNCLRGFKAVEPRYIQVGRAFGGTPRQIDLEIKLRAGLPMVAVGLKLGAAISMITVVVAEMLSSTRGLGFMIKYYAESYRVDATYALIVVVLVIVGLFHSLLNRLTRSVVPYQASGTVALET